MYPVDFDNYAVLYITYPVLSAEIVILVAFSGIIVQISPIIAHTVFLKHDLVSL